MKSENWLEQKNKSKSATLKANDLSIERDIDLKILILQLHDENTDDTFIN